MSGSPAASNRSRHLSLGLVALLCVPCLPAVAAAQLVFGVQADAGGPGDSVNVGILMSGGAGRVAGMQANIIWDANCLSAAAAPGGRGEAACIANRATGKDVHTKVTGSSLRALFLSLADSAPISQDGQLFYCQFNISSSTSAHQCPVTLSNVIASDSVGKQITVDSVVPGVVQIAQGRAPQVPAQRAPVQAPAVVAPGMVEGGAVGQPGGAAGGGALPGAGAPAGSAPAGAAPGRNAPAAAVPGGVGTGRAGVGAPGLPAGYGREAEEAEEAIPEAVVTPRPLTPSPPPAAAAATPSPGAGTPALGTKTVTPQTTPTPKSGTPPAGTAMATTPTPQKRGGSTP